MPSDIFRQKDRDLKNKNIYKSKNTNKEGKGILWSDKTTVTKYPRKARQHKLIKLGIRVHMDDIHHISDYRLCKDDDKLLNNKMGNTTVGELMKALDQLNDDDIPYDSLTKHDVTRWRVNKNKTKERNRKRKEKMELSIF